MRSLRDPLEDEIGIFDTLCSTRSPMDQATLLERRPTVADAYDNFHLAASVVDLEPVSLAEGEGDVIAANYDVLRTGRCRDIS